MIVFDSDKIRKEWRGNYSLLSIEDFDAYSDLLSDFQHLLNLFFRLERRNSKFFKEHGLDRIVLDSYARIREILGYKDLDASTFDLFSRLQQFCWNVNCKVWNTPFDSKIESIRSLKKQLNKIAKR